MPIPTQSSTSTVAEAPRPARDQWDGRSPGSRVNAACRLPDLSLADRNQWLRASARRLQLRGQPWVCIAALRRSTRTTFPHRSFVGKRPSRVLVQRCAVTLSMAGWLPHFWRQRRRLLSPPGRCITLAALSGARPSIGLASETGSRCERVIAAPSRHCPRNGKRIKANTHVTAPLKGVGRHSPATGIRESGDRPGIEQRIPSRWANWAM